MGRDEQQIQTIVLEDFSGGLNSDSIAQPNECRWANNVIWYGNRLQAGPGIIPSLNGPPLGSFGTTYNSYVLGTWFNQSTRYSIPIIGNSTSSKIYVPVPNTASAPLFPLSTTSALYTDITAALSLTPASCVGLQFNQKAMILDTSKTSNCLFYWTGTGNLTQATPGTHYGTVYDQPTSASVVTIVSDSASDNTQTVTISGSLAGVAKSEVLSLTGTTPVVGAQQFDWIGSLLVSASITGTLTITTNGGSVTVTYIEPWHPPDAAKCMAVHNNKLWMGNILYGGTRYSNWITFSDEDDPNTWDILTNVFDLETDDGDEIVACLPLGPDLIVYKRYSICKLNGYNLEDISVQKPFISGIGCILPKSLQLIPLQGPNGWISAHIFWSAKGLCIFDGYSTRLLPLGESNAGKCTHFFDAINAGVSLTTSANTGNELTYNSAFEPSRGIYFLFAPSTTYRLPPGSEDYTCGGMMYDTVSNTLWPIEPNFTPTGSTAYVDAEGKRKLIVGGPYEQISEISYTVPTQANSFTDLVTNGNMETNGTWAAYGAPAAQNQSAAQKRNGSNSWLVTTTALTTGMGAYQSISLTANKLYRLSGWCYTPASAGKLAHIKVKSGVYTLGTIEFTATASAKWQFGYVDFVATDVSAPIVTLEGGSVSSTFYFDDVHCFLMKYKCEYRTPDLVIAGLNTLKTVKEIGILAATNLVNDNEGKLDVTFLPDGVLAEEGGTAQINSTATFPYPTSGYYTDYLAAVANLPGQSFRRFALRLTTPVLSSAYPLIGNAFPPVQMISASFLVNGDRFIA